MLAVIVLAVALLFPAPSQQPQGEPIDRVLGAWQGTIEHAGERRDMILEFVRSRGRVVPCARRVSGRGTPHRIRPSC